MKQVFTVIRREYRERVRTKTFVLTTIGVPVLMVGFIGLQVFLVLRSEKTDQTLAVVDHTGVLFDGLRDRLESGGYSLEPASPGATENLDQRVEDGEIGGYLVLGARTLSEGRATFHGQDTPGAIRRLTLRQAIAQTALEVRLSGADDSGDVASLLDGGELSFEFVGAEDDAGAERERDAAMAAGFGGGLILYMTLIIYGSMVMRAVMEEKKDRVVEIVISSLKPWKLMLGKIVGVGAVGLTQVAVWVVAGGVALSFGIPTLVIARPELDQLSEVREYLPSLGVMALFLAFFVLGYFLYSSLYAAVGAMCSRDEDAQQLQFPVTLMLIIPFVVLMSTFEGPDTAVSAGLSLFPFFSPLLMFPRAVAGVAPWWQVALSLVLMVIALFVVAWVAGRIYRVGILMQGKRPTLPELVRWVREA